MPSLLVSILMPDLAVPGNLVTPKNDDVDVTRGLDFGHYAESFL